MKDKISYETLPNGLTLVKIRLPELHSITNFLCIRSGSRYETADNAGIAHFLEHIVFKGTKSFPDTKVLSEAIEGVGGYFNAWTSNDHTAYWNLVPEKHWQLGAQLPVELAFRALIEPEDIDRERGVIIEEIRMIQDDPARYVDDLSMTVTFPDHQIGQMIIGSEQSIKAMTHQHFIDYRNQFYRPEQAYFVAVGDVDQLDYASLLSEITPSHKPVDKPTVAPKLSNRRKLVHHKTTDQTHLMIATASDKLGLNGSDRFKAQLLSAVLGQGMSSRLFLNVREKKGLAYSVHSSFNAMEDTGMLAIYGGLNTEKIQDSLTAIKEELQNLIDTEVGEQELAKAKQMIIGALEMGQDDSIKLATWYGVSRMLGMKETHQEVEQIISKITSAEIQELAKEIFNPDRLTLAVIGPYQDEKLINI